MGLGECPSDGTLAFAIFFGEPSKSSREAFPNLRAKPFIFCRKLKSESKIGHGFMVEKRPKKFDAEEPRLRARSHSVPPWSVFGHDFWSVFGHDFGPQTCDRNWQTPGPKSENGLAEIRKRPSEFSENAKAKIQKLTFFVSEIGQGFGRNLTKILAENRPNIWSKIGQTFWSKRGLQTYPEAPPTRPDWIAPRHVQNIPK